MSIKTFTGNEGTREQTDNKLWVGLIIRRSVKQQAITVGGTAVKLPTSPLSKRKSLLITNYSTGGQILYLGDSTVSTSDGFPLTPRASILLNIEDDIDVYGIASASGADIRIFEGA